MIEQTLHLDKYTKTGVWKHAILPIMAKSAFSPTLPCLSFSFTSPTITTSRNCIFPSKFYHCPHSSIQYKQRNNRSPLAFTQWRSTQHFSHIVQTAIHAQANQGTQVLEEDTQFVVDESEFVEVGYICNIFGLDGEVRVHPSTDFPKDRFERPGGRLLKITRSGNVTYKELELVSGRSHPGKNQWLLSFRGVNSVDEAKELVGATVLVREDDRPALDDDEYYSRDLIGMSVVLKDTNELVGTVVDIYSTGAGEILRVMLSQTKDHLTDTVNPEKEAEMSGPLIWIPFNEAIVPDVDIQMRELHITPPEGLLELNLRPEGLPRAEKRRQEWKQKRKARQKVSAIRKKLCEMGQEHILLGLSTENEAQKQAFFDQLLSFDFKLFKHALQDSLGVYERSDLSRFLDTKLTRNWWLSLEYLSKNHLQFGRKEYMNRDTLEMHREGLELIAQGQAAVILLMDEEKFPNMNNTNEITGKQGSLALQTVFHPLAEQLLAIQKLANSGTAEKLSIPLIIVATEDAIPFVQLNFEEHDYFGLGEEQVRLLTQERLPCVSSSSDKGEYKILMESPWKIIEAPTGPGGIFSSLLEQGTLETLTGRGIQYVQICTLNDLSVVADPVFFGFVHKQGADAGLKLFAEEYDGLSQKHASTNCTELQPYSVPYQSEEKAYISISRGSEESDAHQLFTTVHKGNVCLDIILSMKYLGKLTKKIYQREYYKAKKHVDHLKEENPEVEMNVYQLRSSIYSLLKFSPSDKIALILYH